MRVVNIIANVLLVVGMTACSSGSNDSTSVDGTLIDEGPGNNQSADTTPDTNPPSDAIPADATPDTSPPADDTTGNNGPIVDNDSIRDWGIVEIDAEVLENDVELSALFGRFSDEISALEFFELLPAEDNCVVTRGSEVDLSEEEDAEDFLPEFGTPYTLLSAGETLTLTSPAGTYASMIRISAGELIGYGQGDSSPELTGPVPDGLILDIPGDQFPAFSNLSFPNAIPVDVTISSGFSINNNSRFEWQPSGNRNSFVDIFATSFNGTVSRVECEVVDDGVFEFPDAIKLLMTNRFVSNFPGFARTVYTVLQTDSGTLILSNTASN